MSARRPKELSVLHYAVFHPQIGGVQVSFASFFESSLLPQLRQIAVLPRHQAREAFYNRNRDRLFLLPGSNGQRTGLRKLCTAMTWGRALIIARPDLVLFWNEIPPRKIRWMIRVLCPRAKLVLYERGRSWARLSTPSLTATLNTLDAFIAVSAAAEAILRKKHGVRQPVHVVHTPVSSGHSPESPRTRNLPLDRRIRLGFAGRLSAEKGLAAVLSTLSLLLRRGIDCELFIAGTGPLEWELRKVAEAKGIQDFCRWLGKVENMRSFYDSVDLMVIPSVRDALPLVSLEAQSWGIPVIVSRVDGLPETLIEGVSGISIPMSVALDRESLNGCDDGISDLIFDPESHDLKPPSLISPEAVADAVEHLVRNRDIYAQFSAAASRHAWENLTWEVYAKRIEETISKIVDSSK